MIRKKIGIASNRAKDVRAEHLDLQRSDVDPAETRESIVATMKSLRQFVLGMNHEALAELVLKLAAISPGATAPQESPKLLKRLKEVERNQARYANA